LPLIDDAVDCPNPLPTAALQLQLMDDVPQDTDPLEAEAAPQSKVYFTLFLPRRCPNDRFPLILHSHGFGGSRQTKLAKDGTLFPDHASFKSIDELVTALPHHGYAVISFDERGQGQSQPQNGGGYARLIDPRAETRDAQAILDWAYTHAAAYNLATEPDSGIPRDLVVGTLGYSLGGSFQLPLAALDERIDTIVPISAWHNLENCLAAGNAIKQSWVQLIWLDAIIPSAEALLGTISTPAVRSLFSKIRLTHPGARFMRTTDQLFSQVAAAKTRPRPVSKEELASILYGQGMGYMYNQEQSGQPWGFGERRARLRAVDALFIQGNRDTLLNLTEAYRNWRYFRQAGGDVRLMTMEGGHMNPVAGQMEGTANCGTLQGVTTILAWFDAKLKGRSSALYESMPTVCLSVAATPHAPMVPEVGLALDDVPVGSQGKRGSVPVVAQHIEASIAAQATMPVFTPLASITSDGQLLAGVPTITRLTVRGTGLAAHPAIAQIGVGIRRHRQLILVDDQLTAFVAGTYTTDPLVHEGDPIMLPAIGEILQQGDEVGLLFYEQSLPYTAVTTIPGGLNLPGGLVQYVLGKPLPHPITSLLNPALGVAVNPNPYDVVAEGVSLPIVTAGQYPGSHLLAQSAPSP
jgi:pimeloyl-ACP methyl ester carboxylesterase